VASTLLTSSGWDGRVGGGEAECGRAKNLNLNNWQRRGARRDQSAGAIGLPHNFGRSNRIGGD